MTKLTDQKVLELAKLSRLKLTNAEVKKFKTEIEAILGYVEQLQKLDLNEIQPSNQVSGLDNVMREDVIKEYQASPDDLLKIAPKITNDRHIKVRRVL